VCNLGASQQSRNGHYGSIHFHGATSVNTLIMMCEMVIVIFSGLRYSLTAAAAGLTFSAELKAAFSIVLNRITQGMNWKATITAPKPRKSIQSQPFSVAPAPVSAKADPATMTRIPIVLIMIDFITAPFCFFVLTFVNLLAGSMPMFAANVNYMKWLIIFS
jgi:hypothetical protein